MHIWVRTEAHAEVWTIDSDRDLVHLQSPSRSIGDQLGSSTVAIVALQHMAKPSTIHGPVCL